MDLMKLKENFTRCIAQRFRIIPYDASFSTAVGKSCWGIVVRSLCVEVRDDTENRAVEGKESFDRSRFAMCVLR
jgi:hypothetical protein